MRVTNEMVDRAINYYLTTHNAVMEPNAMGGAIEAAVGSVFFVNRWDAFSDEEVNELAAGASDRKNSRAIPLSNRTNAAALCGELDVERRRRQGGYQGPGVYEAPDRSEWAVLDAVEVRGCTCVVASRWPEGKMHIVTLTEFNEPLEGAPRYTYLRPLEA